MPGLSSTLKARILFLGGVWHSCLALVLPGNAHTQEFGRKIGWQPFRVECSIRNLMPHWFYLCFGLIGRFVFACFQLRWTNKWNWLHAWQTTFNHWASNWERPKHFQIGQNWPPPPFFLHILPFVHHKSSNDVSCNPEWLCKSQLRFFACVTSES